MEEAPQEWGPPKDANVPEVPAFGLLEAPRRAQKIEISYARTAKKVDIQIKKNKIKKKLAMHGQLRRWIFKALSLYIFTYTCVCVFVCVYTYICIHVHIHIQVDIKALKDDLWESIDSMNPGNKTGKSLLKTTEVAKCVCVCVCGLFMAETQALPSFFNIYLF